MVLRIIDIETTGTDPATARVIEIASVDLQDDNTLANPQEVLVNPGVPIPPESSAVHHLIDADVANAQAIEQVIEQFKGAAAYAAHNAAFERGFLHELLGQPTWVCTYKSALRVWPDAPGYSNQALRYWLKQFEPFGYKRTDISPHRALSDCIVTACILAQIRAGKLATAEQMTAWTSEPALLTTITFGKHRGEKYKDAPTDYLEWMVGAQDMDADRVFTAKHWIGERAKQKPEAAAPPSGVFEQLQQ